MSSAKLSPLTDPDRVKEVYANEATGIQLRGDGTCHFTFSVIRPNHSMPGVMHNDPDEARVVVSRLVLPAPVAMAMFESFQQLKAAVAIREGTTQPTTN